MDKNIENIKIIVKIAKIIIPILIVIFVGWSIFTIIEKNKKIEELQTLKDNQPVVEKIADDYNLIKEAKEEKVEPSALEPKKETIVTPAEPSLPEGTDRFIVSLNSTNDTIAASLLESEYIKDKDIFMSILSKNTKNIAPGAYKISKEMTGEQINKVLTGQPYMKWIVIKPGLRKEEIAEILASTLGWAKIEKENWINKDTTSSLEYTEGVYYPDTYLIPVEEEPVLVAKRLVNKFNENFSGYLGQFTAKNIKWARALTLASIVQREASSNSDMPLIAGILWNRLEQNMALGVDATLQYLRGDKGSGWWAPISVADKQIDSPFNTYKYKGLPPHPISNPGIMAIEAVLNPTETDCLYYIHDKERKTHCAVTYEEHIKNIEMYLK